MLTMYLGGVEISQAVSADRNTTLVAHTIGDVTAQGSNVTSADMTNVLNAGAVVAYPFPARKLRETVTAVCIDSTGTRATVLWSQRCAHRHRHQLDPDRPDDRQHVADLGRGELLL